MGVLCSRFFLLNVVAAGADCLFATLLTACSASCAGSYIEDGCAVVLAALSACAVWAAKGTTFAGNGTLCRQSVVASAFCCL